MAIDETAFVRGENGDIVLNGVRNIRLPEAVVTMRFPDPVFAPNLGRLLPVTAVIPLYLETGPGVVPNDEGVLQLSLSVPHARTLADRLRSLLAEYEPEEDGPQSMN